MNSMHNSPHDPKTDADRHQEHGVLQTLISNTKSSHVAIRSGAWSDPKTWRNGKVPTGGANVLIQQGVSVTYDQASDARINTVVIDGTLRFATYKDTKLVVDTILNSPKGRFDIGSASNPLPGNRKAQIVFTSDRAINRRWDPTELSKGFVSHGIVNIYGADKLDKVALSGDAKAGSSVLKFRQPLKGWQVGDRIVLGGTDYKYSGKDSDNSRFQDEVLTITEIKGNEVRFVNEGITSGDRTVLKYDHVRSSIADTNKLTLYAGNLTRNVTFETENGKAVPLNRRGHFMVMHNPNVKVFNAGFIELGRSDKTKLVDDIDKNVNGTPGGGSNRRGRYSIHIHKTGENSAPVILKGNAVVGNPGWAIVQHNSNAGLEDNVVFDVAGAGISAEGGAERGWWTNNLVVKATGIPWPQAVKQEDAREARFDFGFQGHGYWTQGAGQILNRNNTAISANHTAMDIFGSALDIDRLYREIKTIKVSDLPPQLRKLFPTNQKEVDVRDVPAADITGFESYNSNIGVRIWGRQTNFDGELTFSGKDKETAHQGRSRFKDFKTWGNLWGGVLVQYSSGIDVQNGLILGRDNEKYISNGAGLLNNDASYSGRYDRLKIAGFNEGARFEMPITDKEFIAPTLSNSTFLKNNYNLNESGNEAPRNGLADDSPAYLKLKNNRFESTFKGNKAPIAQFQSKAIGGLAVELNAGTSRDPDPLRPEDGKPRSLASKGIAAYAWDLNNDGTPDRFGRKITHVFDGRGSRTVGLTVYDAQGESNKVQKTISVVPTAYQNAFRDAQFNGGTQVQEPWQSNSQWSDRGWFMKREARLTGGHAKISNPSMWGGFIGQVAKNDKVHKGRQTLSFRLKNKEGAPNNKPWENNKITVSLWGVNGQFQNSAYQKDGPQKVGVLPMQRTALVSKVIGGQGAEGFDWKNISFDTNLGNGYDYLLFQVNTEATRNSGDYVAIDDVRLQGPANNSGGNPLPPTPPTPPNPNPPNPNPPNPNPPSTPPIGGPSLPSGFNPVARLTFDEGSGKVAADTSTQGKNNSGNLLGNTRWAKGKTGQAVAFKGEQDVVTIANSKDINLGTHPKRTVSMWFKTQNAGNDRKQVIYEEGGKNHGINMYVQDDLLYFGLWNKPTAQWQGSWIQTDQVRSNRWQHVALVVDGQGKLQNDTLRAYLDGKQVDSMSRQLWGHNGKTGIGNVMGTTRFHDGVSLQGNQSLLGSVDDLQIYNDALSSSQIQQLRSGV